MNSGTATLIYQETINKMISFCDFSFVNLYLSTASDKCFRYAISNKLYFSMYCSSFVGTLLGTTELIRRQFVGIFKVRAIAFIRTVQTVPISDMNGFLTA